MYLSFYQTTTILDKSQLKGFADSNMNVTSKFKFVFARIENIVGKGGNAGYQHFLLSPQFFKKTSYAGSLIVGTVW